MHDSLFIKQFVLNILFLLFCGYYSEVTVRSQQKPIKLLSVKNLQRSQMYKDLNSDTIDTHTSEQFAKFKGSVKEYYTWSAPNPTIGEPWPIPFSILQSKNIFYFVSNPIFVFNCYRCALLLSAIERYRERIFKLRLVTQTLLKNVPGTINKCASYSDCYIDSINITMKNCNNDEWPNPDMNESYSLSLARQVILISAETVWGVLRALETLSQLIYCVIKDSMQALAMNEVEIVDYPKYSYRGLLLDTSRHFIPFEDILAILDGMEMNKLNVLHWHLTDDQSFPFESRKHPEMHKRGAYQLSMVYRHSVIREIVQYAKQRGIRVIPEIDIPGHTDSWSKSHPELMSMCTEENGNVSAFGPLNPILTETYQLIFDLYSELAMLFPDKYMHLGMDEVGLNCWRTDPSIIAFMKDYEMNTASQLNEMFITRIQNLFTQKFPNKIMVLWQEALSVTNLSNKTVFQIWKSTMDELTTIRNSKYKMIFSTGFYLDHLSYGSSWTKIYLNEFGFRYDEDFIGGEVCMWNEYQSKETIHTAIWPKATAFAEKVWFGMSSSLLLAGGRLEEQRCRMLRRGIKVGVASGPYECLYMAVNSRSFEKERGEDLKIYSNVDILKYYISFIIGLLVGYIVFTSCHKCSKYVKMIVLLPIFMICIHYQMLQ